MPSFSPTSNKAYVEFRVGIKRHACFSYVAKSKAESKKKQVMQSDQEVQVCGNFWWMEDKLLCMNQLSYLFPLSLGTRAIFLFSLSLSLSLSFFFFSSVFDMPCEHVAYLLWICIFSLLFCNTQVHFTANFLERVAMGKVEFFIFVECMDGMFLHNSHCRSRPIY